MVRTQAAVLQSQNPVHFLKPFEFVYLRSQPDPDAIPDLDDGSGLSSFFSAAFHVVPRFVCFARVAVSFLGRYSCSRVNPIVDLSYSVG